MNPPAADTDTREAFRFPTASQPEAAEKVPSPPRSAPDEGTLDEGIEASFPASDPVSVTVSPVPSPEAARRGAPAPARGRWRTPALAMVASSALVGLGLAALVNQRRRRPALRLPFLR